ncbi:hypothetical protein EZ428_14505 [Pedobacter frigiditerrae]|uniref:Uncharacterized protein n=1 Tax=Pedobacter frigiditerrae TaxID=2530452 RepID=A0A4R0MTR8_9SPHI|nr:hypothetical protein [Pedobacter frigiditerrae]TCC90481.1 hypothetical protein EZ428_14505 [Pedobacter frigiditerrae]
MIKILYRFFFIVLLSTAISSCSENYEDIDPSSFNQKISLRYDVKTPEELLKSYYIDSNEVSLQITVSKKIIEKNNYQITLINERVDDDAVRKEKIMMFAKFDGTHWKVNEIRRNWKCEGGRGGSTEWGINECP